MANALENVGADARHTYRGDGVSHGLVGAGGLELTPVCGIGVGNARGGLCGGGGAHIVVFGTADAGRRFAERDRAIKES